ncbi:MAG: YdcF family protein [Lachnospiraceae bacterium]|nr:YdcF family protein [Lachnospiraceae bacterium]
MWQISSVVFFIFFCIFLGIMVYDPRTLWSGVSFFWMMICLAVSLFFLLSQYSEWLVSHDALIEFLIIVYILSIGCVIAFPGILIVMFFFEGIKVIRREGVKPSNLLSLLFSILMFAYLVVWPMIGNLEKNALGTILYIIIGFSAIYMLSLMAIYSLSAILNLIHLKKNRKADYIVVLGAGVIGRRVTPLLAARIERGIELLRYNPNAVMIMSGGQGPGEDIPECEAMAAYAIEKGVDADRIIKEQKSVSTEENLLFSRKLMHKDNPKIVIVTTAYHVFRALILAKQQGIKCVGFGAKTKWYFTLNALIREFVGYLQMTWKKHISVIGIIAGIIVIVNIIAC